MRSASRTLPPLERHSLALDAARRLAQVEDDAVLLVNRAARGG